MKPSPTPEEIEKDLESEEFILNNDSNQKFKMKINYGKTNLIFFVESLRDFPRKYYELNTFLSNIQNEDENFFIFQNCQKLVFGIKQCVNNKKYKISDTNDV